MPYQIIIVLVLISIVIIAGIVLIFTLAFRNDKLYREFIEKANRIKVGMNAKDVFQIMNCKATTIEEDGDSIVAVWKDQQWHHGTLLLRSLKIVIDKDERVVSVVGENLEK